MVNITELENAIIDVEKEYDVVLGRGICYSFIEKIDRWLGKVTYKYKSNNPDWFRKVLYNVANEMEIRKIDRRKVYMSLAGKYYGGRGGRKAASNRREKEIQKSKSTDHLQAIFSLEKKVFTQAEIH